MCSLPWSEGIFDEDGRTCLPVNSATFGKDIIVESPPPLASSERVLQKKAYRRQTVPKRFFSFSLSLLVSTEFNTGDYNHDLK